MLVAAFMFVISIAAMVQFAVFTWRAGLLRVAAEALPGETSGADTSLLNRDDFQDASAIHEICPALSASSVPNLKPVRLYHNLLSALNALGSFLVPGSSDWLGWTKREMALCTRYSNVVLSRRLQQNQRQAAMMRSF